MGLTVVPDLSLYGLSIMKAKSVYNNLKQYSSRSCGIEDNASFAPTNGRDRTDRQDRQTYRNPKRTL